MASKTLKQSSTAEALSPAQWIGLAGVCGLIAGILLIAGGDWGWWQGWVYAVVLFLVTFGGRIWAERRHPGLLAERGRYEKAQNVKSWDRLLSPLMAISTSILPILVAGLDHRWGWSPAFAVELTVLGLGLIIAGYAFATWALAENRFFSGVVRIQEDRGHQVCDTGPYQIVRHPGYAGSLLALLGMVLGLASWWTLIPAVLALAIAVLRTWLEDQTLQAELPGYREYAQRTRYRLIPGIF